MMNMNLLAVVTPPSIYHGFYTQKTFWEEKFVPDDFTAVNMKNCGRWNVRKHRYIKGSDKYVTLYILFKFDILGKMIITSSDSKDNSGRSGKCLITSLGIKSKASPKKYKKAGMPSEISARRTFQRLLGSLINYLVRFMREGGPNMSLLTVTFTYQDSLQSVWLELISSTCTFTL